MNLRRVLLTVLVALSAVAVAPPLSAYAGGPTSVLIVNPSQQQARAAYNSDSVYTALTVAVGDGQTGSSDPPPGLGAGGGEDVRLTWLIHDVQIWRIDRIHLTDGMWIETVVDHGGEGGMFDRPSFWHRAADPAGLLATLTAAGLLGDSGAAPSPVIAEPSPAAESEATVPASATSFPAAVVAGLIGLVLGAAGALVALRGQRRTPAERPARVTLSG